MFATAKKTEKVSDRIIEQIRDAVLAGRLKPGDRVASEKELVAQFGVSKATMREALRVLETMGLVEIRKGTQGGVFIAEVDMKTTIHSVMNFLHFKSVSIHDITMLRFLLEPPVACLAAERLTPEDVSRLERLIELGDDNQAELSKDIGFHRHLARLSDNPVLILIMDFLDNLVRDVKFQLQPSPAFYNQVKQSHRRILDCLLRRDSEGARREMALDLLHVGDHLADLAGAPRFDPAMLGLDRQGRPAGAQGREVPAAQQMDPAALGRGMLFRQIGSGDLYMLVPREDDPALPSAGAPQGE